MSEDLVLCSRCKVMIAQIRIGDPIVGELTWVHAADHSPLCQNAIATYFVDAQIAEIRRLREKRKRLTDLLLDANGNLKQGAALRKAQAEMCRQARNLSAQIWRRTNPRRQHVGKKENL